MSLKILNEDGKEINIPSAERIRAGLYRLTYVIDNHSIVEFNIEQNDGDYENRPIGDWIVCDHIRSRSHGDEDNQWDNSFARKKDAVFAIAEYMHNGNYIYGEWGWHYRKDEDGDVFVG